MNIYLDIESIPDMRPGKRDACIQAARDNFKAPSTLTKEQAAADLGLTDAIEIKFTSKDAMLARWAERFREEKADEVGDAEWRKTSFDGAKGQLCCIGVALDDSEPITIYGDGSQLRAFTHVDDIVEGLVAVAARGQSGEVFNLGNNRTIGLLDMIRKLEDVLNVKAKIDWQDWQDYPQ